MDEFLSIAIWVLIAFLSINTAIIWFSTSSTFTDNGLGLVGGTDDNSFNQTQVTALQGTNCSTVSSTIFDFAICFFNQLVAISSSIISSLWGFLFAWTTLLTAILSVFGSAGQLFVNIFVPFFALVELIAILLLVSKIAAIARGVMGI